MYLVRTVARLCVQYLYLIHIIKVLSQLWQSTVTAWRAYTQGGRTKESSTNNNATELPPTIPRQSTLPCETLTSALTLPARTTRHPRRPSPQTVRGGDAPHRSAASRLAPAHYIPERPPTSSSLDRQPCFALPPRRRAMASASRASPIIPPAGRHLVQATPPLLVLSLEERGGDAETERRAERDQKLLGQETKEAGEELAERGADGPRKEGDSG